MKLIYALPRTTDNLVVIVVLVRALPIIMLAVASPQLDIFVPNDDLTPLFGFDKNYMFTSKTFGIYNLHILEM